MTALMDIAEYLHFICNLLSCTDLRPQLEEQYRRRQCQVLSAVFTVGFGSIEGVRPAL